MSRYLHRPTGILKVYIEALKGFNPVFSPDGVSTASYSQDYILEMVASMGMIGVAYIPRTEGGEELLIPWVNQQSQSLHDLQQLVTCFG